MSLPSRSYRKNAFKLYAPYATEIDAYLKKKEEERLPYHCRSPQLQYRLDLINWVRSVSEELNLSTVTLHLAVYFLDLFMDNHTISIVKLELIALVCISLSAKFEEQDSRVPKIPDLNNMIGNKYRKRDFMLIECLVLNFFEWKLARPTIAHFTEHYKLFIILEDDCATSVSHINLKNIAFSTLFKCLDIALDDHKVNKLKPSYVAAACCLATRQILKLSPYWNNSLQTATSYTEYELEDRCSTIVRHYNKESGNTDVDENEAKEEDMSDSGYVTGSASHSPSTPPSRNDESSRKSIKCNPLYLSTRNVKDSDPHC